MPRSGLLKLLNILGLLSTIYLIFFGVFWQWMIAVFLSFFTICMGSMVWHRLLSHRSWKSPRWFEIFGSLVKTVMMAGSTIVYVAIHREHHIKADTKDDPHSPINGIFKLHYGLYNYKLRIMSASDLLRDKFHLFIHRNYLNINLVYAGLIVLIFWDFSALTYAWLVPGFFSVQGGATINSLNHLWGYRNHDTKDNSKNNLITGYIGLGEGWHNNHHANPNKVYFGEKWWEVDVAGLFIKLLRTDK